MNKTQKDLCIIRIFDLQRDLKFYEEKLKLNQMAIEHNEKKIKEIKDAIKNYSEGFSKKELKYPVN